MPAEISREDVQHLSAGGAQLVEVLPPEEYKQEHLPGAINVPLKQLTRETVQQLQRKQPVIVYCHDHQ